MKLRYAFIFLMIPLVVVLIFSLVLGGLNLVVVPFSNNGHSDTTHAVNTNDNQTGAGTYSVGYMAGQLTKASVPPHWFLGSMEGELNMGRNGSPYIRQSDEKMINPRKFSGVMDEISLYQPFVEKNVVIEYHESKANYSTRHETRYMALRIYPQSGSSIFGSDSTYFDIFDDPNDEPNASESGVRVGRITKISEKGMWAKTWEVTIQMGNEGNQFKHLSVNDDRMYKVLVEALKSGLQYKIHTTELLIGLTFNSTNYAIWKLESVGGSTTEQ